MSAIEIPDGLTEERLLDGFMERNISISGGQAHLGGEVIRIANMANVREQDVLRMVEVLENVLEENGFNIVGDGVEEARSVLSGVTQ